MPDEVAEGATQGTPNGKGRPYRDRGDSLGCSRGSGSNPKAGSSHQGVADLNADAHLAAAYAGFIPGGRLG